MTSPARNHFLRKTAARVAEAAEASNPLRGASGHELMLAQLAEHKRQLKQVQSIERKADTKRAMLPAYAAWVQGVLESGAGLQDEVFMTVMVWHIDVGDFAAALPLAAYAIQHDLVMPDHYRRTTACLIAEEYAAMAIKAVQAGQAVDAEALAEVADLVTDQDMPDEVRAKLHKAIGYVTAAAAGKADPVWQQAMRESALRHLRRALELHDKAGVIKDIERLEREIKNAAPAGAKEGDGKG